MSRNLHPDDDPNLLRGPEDWAMRKHGKLVDVEALELMEYVNGQFPRPVIGQDEDDDEDDLAIWNIQNAKTMALLLKDIHPKIRRTLTHCKSAAQIWTTLSNNYESRSETNQYVLTTKFYNYKYEPTMKIRDYIAKKTDLAAACRNSGIEVSDNLLIATILGGLPSDFKSVVLAFECKPAAQKTLQELTTFLVRKEMIDDKVKALPAQTNQSNNGNNNANEPSAAFSHGVRGGRGGSRNANQRLNQQNFQNGQQQQQFQGRCGNCNKVGSHRAAECRAPPQNRNNNNFNNNFNRNNNFPRQQQSNNNYRFNPYMQRQNFNQQFQPQQNLNNNLNYQQQPFNQYPNRQQGANYAGVRNEDEDDNNFFGQVGCWSHTVQMKVSALNIQTNDNDVWFGDSGAGDHMTGRRDWFTSFEELPPSAIEVILGDDHILPATGVGLIKVKQSDGSPNAMKRVLYVPNLR